MTDPKPDHLDFIREIIAEDIASGKHSVPITRFPPEPNGYLHIGHAKAICLNFGLGEEYASIGGCCHLRFDDTNPSKEDQEYVDSIENDIRWLGFDWGEHLYFASNIFNYFYECALDLIKKGLAYVDEQTVEQLRETRGTSFGAGVESPYRNRSVEENLARFDMMKKGEFKEGEAVLRAKIDLASPNMNMRDPILYRVMFAEHHNAGNEWCIYPMYDFAHPLEDAYEYITHSLCSLEFENHRPLYDWVVDNCPTPCKPRQIEFARLNLTYTVMSKRKLLQLVKEGFVSNWDDPRMPTLSGMRRRGYTPESIRRFCRTIGMTKFNSLTDVALLEHSVRSHLNDIAPRRMAVMNPLKVTITNFGEDQLEYVDVQNNPEHPEEGMRQVPLTREVWIERDDFMDDPPKKYFRLAPGRTVRLRGGYCITCTDVVRNEAGEPVELLCEYIPGTIGSNPPEGIQCRAAIHWVSVAHAVDAEVRLYDRLFNVENPDAAEGGFLSAMNKDSFQTVTGVKVEPSLAETAPEYRCQFERIGYFVADRKDHIPGEKLVFNRTVALKDSWAKKQ